MRRGNAAAAIGSGANVDQTAEGNGRPVRRCLSFDASAHFKRLIFTSLGQSLLHLNEGPFVVCKHTCVMCVSEKGQASNVNLTYVLKVQRWPDSVLVLCWSHCSI